MRSSPFLRLSVRSGLRLDKAAIGICDSTGPRSCHNPRGRPVIGAERPRRRSTHHRSPGGDHDPPPDSPAPRPTTTAALDGPRRRPRPVLPDHLGRPARPARRICRACPVQAACLDWALRTGEPDGVWGW
ncbi:WhiB family transcriptional regulator [Nonomuraea sp. NPDC005650]|uniref:WhiB family transcriptional regulator n=1 Tax=Nonomuraea sp. NPDC005650 TaxID=3157045 RepID=UPI00339EA78A